MPHIQGTVLATELLQPLQSCIGFSSEAIKHFRQSAKFTTSYSGLYDMTGKRRNGEIYRPSRSVPFICPYNHASNWT